VAVAGLLLAAWALLWLHQHGEKELQGHLLAGQTQLGIQAVAQSELLLRQVQNGLGHLAQDGEHLLADRRQATAQLATLFHSTAPGLLVGLYLVDRNGELLAEYPAGGLASLTVPGHLLPGSSPFVPSPKHLRLGDDYILLLPQPLPVAQEDKAELAALVSLAGLRNLSLPVVREGGFSFFLDDQGALLLHPERQLAARPFTETISAEKQPEFYELLQAMLRGERGSGFFHLPPTSAEAAAGEPGRKLLLSFVPFNLFGNPWSIAFARPAETIESGTSGQAAFLGILVGVFCLAALPLIPLHRTNRRNRQLLRCSQRLTTEKEQLRTAAELAERRSQQLLDNAGDAIFFISPEDGSLLELNRQAEELLGYTAAEIHSLSLTVLFPGHQRRRYLRLVRSVLDHGYGEDDDLLFRRKDGTLFTGAVHARLGELGAGRVVHGVLRNVTEIKRIERELRQKNQDLTLINEIAWQVSGNRNLPTMLSEVLARTVQATGAAGGGVYLAGDEGSSLRLAVHQGIDEAQLGELEQITPGRGLAGRVAATGQPCTSADLQKDRRLRAAGVREAGWRAFQAVPLISQGTPLGVLFLFSREKHISRREELNLLLAIGRQLGTAVQSVQLFDALQWQYRLTRASNRELKQSRRQLEENLSRLEENNRELERLDRMKSNFLAMASHELRTPLTYVIAGSELLKSTLADRLSAEQNRVVDAIQQGGQRLESIVQDLLEAARIESQNLYLARELVDLPALIAEVGRSFSPVFEQRRLFYRMHEFPAPLTLYGDPHHLSKTFQRLLENAIKFTPEGGEIEIRAAIRTADDLRLQEPVLRSFSTSFFRTSPAERLLQITVRDSGVGIDPDEHVRVFDRFYEIGRISEHFTSRTHFGGKGVGLGLSLVKGMIEAHGGMVWVESSGAAVEAGGSAFHVLLPLASDVSEVVDAAG